MRGDAAATAITTLDDLAILNLRQTFGGSFGPYLFSQHVSEPATDLANDLITCPEWDEEQVKSPHLDLVPPPSILPPATAFAPALPPDVIVPLQDHGKLDVHIDDIITVGVCTPRWRRLAGSTLLALHILGRPISSTESLARDNWVALNKLFAEG